MEFVLLLHQLLKYFPKAIQNLQEPRQAQQVNQTIGPTQKQQGRCFFFLQKIGDGFDQIL